jgi:proteic killer suppression protein
MNVRSFRHKPLQRLLADGSVRGLAADQVRRIKAALFTLETANGLAEIAAFPGWRLHELKGQRTGTWSMWISGNWRLTFRCEELDIHDLDLEDYH